MAKFDTKTFISEAVVPAAAINVAGFAEPTIDNWINANVAPISSIASKNTNAKYAKYMKMSLYTGLGLLGQAVIQHHGKGKTADMAAKAFGYFMYGLSGATAAEDPVINVPNPQYQVPGRTAVQPARQVVVRTGNVIS